MLRFVREKGDDEPVEKPKKHTIQTVDGVCARETYENVLQIPSTSSSLTKVEPKTERIVKRKRRKITHNFDKNKLFKAATDNDVATIEQMILNNRSVNVTDQFGWSALMMAACEGHIDATKVLIRRGAKIKTQNKQNDSALSLAEKKNHTHIVDYLHAELEFQSNNTICLSSDDDTDALEDLSAKNELKTFFCDICNQNFSQSTQCSHIASTVHRFNRKDSQNVSRHFGIPESNKGFKMLLQQGWNRESGLGADSDGIIYPIKTSLRKPRSGLGTQQPKKPRVTHFEAFDSSAIKSRKPLPSMQIVKTKRQMRAEKLNSQRKDRRLRKILS